MVRLAGIEYDSIVDGEGWRIAIFVQGCLHNCEGCHNPSTHRFDCGKPVEVEEMFEDIVKRLSDNALLDGITLSGGDPLFQANELKELCRKLKEFNSEISIWVYTGFEFKDLLLFKNNKLKHKEKANLINNDMIEMLNYIDVLVDGKFELANRTVELPYRGSTNQLIIDVKQSLRENKLIEYELYE